MKMLNQQRQLMLNLNLNIKNQIGVSWEKKIIKKSWKIVKVGIKSLLKL